MEIISARPDEEGKNESWKEQRWLKSVIWAFEPATVLRCFAFWDQSRREIASANLVKQNNGPGSTQKIEARLAQLTHTRIQWRKGQKPQKRQHHRTQGCSRFSQKGCNSKRQRKESTLPRSKVQTRLLQGTQPLPDPPAREQRVRNKHQRKTTDSGSPMELLEEADGEKARAWKGGGDLGGQCQIGSAQIWGLLFLWEAPLISSDSLGGVFYFVDGCWAEVGGDYDADFTVTLECGSVCYSFWWNQDFRPWWSQWLVQYAYGKRIKNFNARGKREEA